MSNKSDKPQMPSDTQYDALFLFLFPGARLQATWSGGTVFSQFYDGKKMQGQIGTATVDSLVRRGWIESSEEKTQGRPWDLNWYTITEAGKRAYELRRNKDVPGSTFEGEAAVKAQEQLDYDIRCQEIERARKAREVKVVSVSRDPQDYTTQHYFQVSREDIPSEAVEIVRHPVGSPTFVLGSTSIGIDEAERLLELLKVAIKAAKELKSDAEDDKNG